MPLAPAVSLLPWLVLIAFVLLRVRLPRELPPPPAAKGRGVRVSVIVPARNEAVNIGDCVRSLAASTHPDVEIIVVDDRSEDDTAERARAAAQAAGAAGRTRVLAGSPLPEGWLGKPWACAQGAKAATGEVLLFTDADTRHGPDLIGRALAGLEEDGADLLTVAGRQLLETFWERVVQPQVFLTMLLRFHDVEGAVGRGRWRDAIANGQFLLFPRGAYERIGGHGAVRGEVVEDLALAQMVVRGGMRLSVRRAEDDLATRMYRSLEEIVRGWSKNIVLGGLRTMPPALRPLTVPSTLLSAALLWLAPPLVLLAWGGPVALAASAWGSAAAAQALPAVPPAAAAWAGGAVVLSLAFWAGILRRFGVPAAYALTYPLGAAVVMGIFMRAWVRGRRVEWKGRTYTVSDGWP